MLYEQAVIAVNCNYAVNSIHLRRSIGESTEDMNMRTNNYNLE